MSEESIKIADIIFSGQHIKGEVGIEVEIEGARLPNAAGKYWTVTRDGSLRGEESFEYVLTAPIPREEVSKALSGLYDRFTANKSRLDDTGRAGVHIHINVRDMTLSEVYTFIFLYLILERPLTAMCGEDRVGNLFCLRAVDAEFLLVTLRDVVKSHEFRALRSDNLRYAGINLTALCKYGSLEFRGMASPVGQDVIEQWTSILLTIKDAVKQFKSPVDVVSGVSHFGGVDFARSILGDHFHSIPCDDWNAEVTFGMRLIQPIVNNFSEDNLRKVEKAAMEQREYRNNPPEVIAPPPNGNIRYDAGWELTINRALANPNLRFGSINTI